MIKTKHSLIEKIVLQQIRDDCVMCIAESKKQIPFLIKRVYYMVHNTPGLPRGYHTHKELNQVIFCIQGSVKMVLDDGHHREEIILDEPATGLMLRPMVWHEMHDINQDTIMLVFASAGYDESDYIRDYASFKMKVDELCNL